MRSYQPILQFAVSRFLVLRNQAVLSGVVLAAGDVRELTGG